MIRPLFFWTLGTVFTAVICVAVFLVLAKGEDAARTGSDKFATALMERDTSLAPEGGADYIEDIHARYQGVSGARVIDVRNHRVGTGDDGRTYYVSNLMLQTGLGPVALELEFDDPSLDLASEKVTDVRELAPGDVPDGKLSDAQLADLAKAFAARGGAARAFALDATIAKAPAATPDAPVAPVATPAKPKVSKAQREAEKRLRCVQKAKGDVNKMARC